MKSNYCQVDETTTPVIDKERHKAAREYLWMVRAVMERLGFEQALDENKAVAGHTLTEIQHLYKIEKTCDENYLSEEERKTRRNELSRPIMETLKTWMETEGVKYGDNHLHYG